MNMNEFNKTKYAGLYISIENNGNKGKKYICRFQQNGKRYVKTLGFTILNNLDDEKANQKMIEYKNSLSNQINKNKKSNSKPASDVLTTAYCDVNSKITIDGKTMSLANLIDEYKKQAEILQDGYNLKVHNLLTLKEGVQKVYDLEEIKPYQVELIKMQKYLEATKKKMIILFEGRDASGKGGAIRRITRYMNNKHYRVVALGKPNDTQRHQWYLQRYIEKFPTGGEVVLFDRSWYNRAMVEPVFGFCTQEQYETFMEDVVNFEHDLVRQDIILVKLYFSVSKAEQLKRFERRMTDPLRQWKLSEVDLQAQVMWDEISKYKYEMLQRTNSRSAPWHIVRSDNKHLARLEAIKIILNSVNYDERNPMLNYTPNENINIPVQKELERMRKKKDY